MGTDIPAPGSNQMQLQRTHTEIYWPWSSHWRIAGQMISVIYALLKKDQAVLDKLPPGVKPPEPTLYDQKVHRKHRTGQYSAPSTPKPAKLIQLSPYELNNGKIL